MVRNTHLIRVLEGQKTENEAKAKPEDKGSEFLRLVKDIMP